VFRSLGLLHRKRQEAPAARAAFDKYLATAPEAGDAGLIQSYLTEMQ
jgi:beta-barrel assembly-enhancing protease